MKTATGANSHNAALLHGAATGDLDLVRQALDDGADIECRDENESTASVQRTRRM